MAQIHNKSVIKSLEIGSLYGLVKQGIEDFERLLKLQKQDQTNFIYIYYPDSSVLLRSNDARFEVEKIYHVSLIGALMIHTFGYGSELCRRNSHNETIPSTVEYWHFFEAMRKLFMNQVKDLYDIFRTNEQQIIITQLPDPGFKNASYTTRDEAKAFIRELENYLPVLEDFERSNKILIPINHIEEEEDITDKNLSDIEIIQHLVRKKRKCLA